MRVSLRISLDCVGHRALRRMVAIFSSLTTKKMNKPVNEFKTAPGKFDIYSIKPDDVVTSGDIHRMLKSGSLPINNTTEILTGAGPGAVHAMWGNTELWETTVVYDSENCVFRALSDGKELTTVSIDSEGNVEQFNEVEKWN